jgi:hypothetical protein
MKVITDFQYEEQYKAYLRDYYAGVFMNNQLPLSSPYEIKKAAEIAKNAADDLVKTLYP